MTETPEDIRKKAEATISGVYGPGFFDPNLHEAIAQALLDERERCAEIIEHRPLAIPDRQELAAYIRSGWHSLFSTRPLDTEKPPKTLSKQEV